MEININEFAPVGTKACEGMCERQIVIIDRVPLVICTACNRIVVDNREKEIKTKK